MATTQTKLVGFCLGDKANYSATAYANHIWFDPTNKQILLNGIEYIPKKLSELVNDKNFLTSITKAMVENVLTGNITSHTHTFASITSKPTNLYGYGITDAMYFYEEQDYLAARFNGTSLATKASKYYIEFWQSGAGWFNLKAGKFITAGGTSSQFLKGDGSLDSTAYLPLSGGTMANTNVVTNLNADLLDGFKSSDFVRNQNITSTSSASIDANNVWFNAVKHDYRWKNVPNNGIASLLDLTYSQDWRSQIFIQPTSLLKIYARARYSGTTWTAWREIAFTDSNVATATALTSSAGSATQPIYFSNGKPVACSYTLAKSVPSNAVFTDTTYSVATASADGLMSAAMFKAEKVSSISVRQGAVQSEEPIRNHDIYVTYNKDKALNSDAHIVGGDVQIKIPNATKDYDGSMSYTDKRKLDGISPYAPKKVVALRLSFNADATVTVISGGGDYDMTQDAELMGSKYVEQTSTNNLYLTTFKLDTTASSTDTLNQLFNNNFVKFSFMGKSTDGISNYSITVKSNFDIDTLDIQFVSTKQDDSWVVDCVWEFF